MKKLVSVLLIFVLAMPLVGGGRRSKVRPTMLDMKKVLTAYGFKGGSFTVRDSKIMNKIDMDAEDVYGLVEKSSSIDTPEEFLTATYFSPIKIDRTSAAKIRWLLPRNKVGALKLCAMWLKKLADSLLDIYDKTPNTKNYSENHLKVVAKIKAKAGLSDRDVSRHYNKAIGRYITKIGKKWIGKYYSQKMFRGLMKPFIEYYQNATKDGLMMMVQAYVLLQNYMSIVNNPIRIKNKLLILMLL